MAGLKSAGCRRKVGGRGEAGYVGVARAVDGNAKASVIETAAVIAGAAKVCAVKGSRAGGVQLRHKRVIASLVSCLLGARGGGEVGRCRVAGDKGIAGAVHGDPSAYVITGATEVRAVDKGRTAGVQLCHEGIIEAAIAGMAGTEGAGRTWER